MEQRTHTWIALRAVALLEDEGEFPDLVKLFEPHVKAAVIGAWLPGEKDAKDRRSSPRSTGWFCTTPCSTPPWSGSTSGASSTREFAALPASGASAGPGRET